MKRIAVPGTVAGLSLAVGCALAFQASAPCAAQAPRANGPRVAGYVPGSLGVPQPEPKVSLQFPQPVSLGRALAALFRQTPYKYQVIAEQGNTVINAKFERVPLTTALNEILAQDQRKDQLVWTFSPRDNLFTIDREFIQIGEVDGENRVSLTNARLTRLLPELFNKMGAKYRIEPDVPAVPITMQLRPSQWSIVLPMVMLEAYRREPGVDYSKDGDTWVVHLHKTPVGLSATGEILPDAGRLVTLGMTDANLKDTLARLFQGSDWKYQV